jgi:hypothetical protein
MLCQVVCDDAVLKTRSAALLGSRLPSIAACDSEYIRETDLPPTSWLTTRSLVEEAIFEYILPAR